MQMQREAKPYLQKPVEVEGFQFDGWQNAEAICAWLPGCFFVPRGYDHRLRVEGEKDRSRGDILEHAEPFLIVPVQETVVDILTNHPPRLTRIDPSDWIVKDRAGRVVVMKDREFRSLYNDVSGKAVV